VRQPSLKFDVKLESGTGLAELQRPPVPGAAFLDLRSTTSYGRCAPRAVPNCGSHPPVIFAITLRRGRASTIVCYLHFQRVLCRMNFKTCYDAVLPVRGWVFWSSADTYTFFFLPLRDRSLLGSPNISRCRPPPRPVDRDRLVMACRTVTARHFFIAFSCTSSGGGAAARSRRPLQAIVTAKGAVELSESQRLSRVRRSVLTQAVGSPLVALHDVY